ncbi:ATP-dependent zinc metalloprotease FtsH [Blastopirellula sp. JC732]|uniref:ATP-dependent zinc metalloprotease FtsH n=1 Tax=Blastopirellula sediminis TaxID=2894196 RepID=A0A9X1SGW7_9BACT|nr:ATP-dependent zinc metalloprotease FtsH [Blastopirellula sediminis]MCC9607280.1 ATP-dependent zinc metalloprotease FtsH [Blastopirellula sediminis]MCC9629427.1 ATP-dependent zinc metalloprotease FtsH [Blastopirellula sediminis]
MDNHDEPPRRSGDSRANNSILYIVVAIVVAFFIAIYFIRPSRDTITPAQLVDLIDAHEPDASGKPVGSLSIENSKGKKILYSNFRNATVSKSMVSAVVDREDLDADNKDIASSKQKGVPIVTYLPGDEQSLNEITDALKAHGFKDYSGDPGDGFLEIYGGLLFMTALIVILFYLMMRRLGGAGSAIAFGRSRGKMHMQDDLNISFEDVAGIEEAVEEVKEIVDFLRSPDKYQELGGRIPKGVLLVGPPGTGKTLLAKAIAGEAGVTFFSLSGSDFVEMFVGVGAARVRDMFQQAAAKSPCIIFIDELDALGKTRGSGMVGGHDEREQTLNALLVEMDGFDSNSGIIIIAATNRPEMLDPALLRPGRFDRQVLVDRPDAAGRADILKVHVKSVKLDESVDVKKVASITAGFAGADLANLVNEAALLAARKGKPAVSMEEFDEGVERVTAGLEKKQRVMQEEEKNRVAYHESGHALVAYCLPNTDPVHKVSIIPRGLAALGYTMQRPTEDRFLMTQGELESRIQVLLAGTVAEEMVYDEISTGASNDLERATELARGMVTDYGMSRLGRVNYRQSGRSAFIPEASDERSRSHSEETTREIDIEIKRILDEMLQKTRSLLSDRRDALIALAKRLIEVESVDGEELRRVIEEHSHGPRIVPGTDAPKRTRVTGEAEKQDEGDSSTAEGAS